MSLLTLESHAGQVLLVVAEDLNATTASLTAYEDGHTVFTDIRVNLGRNGLAWDDANPGFPHDANDPVKREGDGKAPAGVFALTSSFGYGDESFPLPYRRSTADTICVDDVDSPLYNQILPMPAASPKSFEYMKRQDEQYRIGAVLAYNPEGGKGRGSCIFLHVEKSPGHPTAGCTSMRHEALRQLLQWLDIGKTPVLVQIPRSALAEARRQFSLP